MGGNPRPNTFVQSSRKTRQTHGYLPSRDARDTHQEQLQQQHQQKQQVLEPVRLKDSVGDAGCWAAAAGVVVEELLSLVAVAAAAVLDALWVCSPSSRGVPAPADVTATPPHTLVWSTKTHSIAKVKVK